MDMLVFFILLMITLIDLQEKRIPDVLNLVLLVLSPVCNAFWLADGVLSLLVALLLYAASGKRLGLGDVKLFAVLGAHIGKEHLFELYMLSFFSAALVCILLLARKKISPQGEIAFGPYICLAWLLIRWPILHL